MYTISLRHSQKIQTLNFEDGPNKNPPQLSEGVNNTETQKVMEKVQKWIHERLEKNPEIHDKVKGLFEGLAKGLKEKMKDPTFFQASLNNYITNTENSIKNLEIQAQSAKDPKEKVNIENTLHETKLAYTRGLLNLTRIHAQESGDTTFIKEIGDISADLVVEESKIHAAAKLKEQDIV